MDHLNCSLAMSLSQVEIRPGINNALHVTTRTVWLLFQDQDRSLLCICGYSSYSASTQIKSTSLTAFSQGVCQYENQR